MASDFYLVSTTGESNGRCFFFNKNVVTIGRDPDRNDLVINQRSISNKHCKLSYKKGRLNLLDLKSTNGIKSPRKGVIRGKKTPVLHGDEIGIGHSSLKVLLHKKNRSGFFLMQLESDRPALVYHFDQDKVEIGRSIRGNGLVIKDPFISGLHARISYEGSKYHILDLGSTNGTYLRGTMLTENQPHAIESGDFVNFGKKRFIFYHCENPKNGISIGLPSAIKRNAGIASDLFISFLNSLVKKKRFLISCLMVMLLFSFFTVSGSADGKAGETTFIHNSTSLPANGVFGYTKTMGKKNLTSAHFHFTAKSERALLCYTAGSIDTGDEVSIHFNGSIIGNVPVSKDRWRENLRLSLPPELINKTGKNRLEFHNRLNPEKKERWAIKDLRILYPHES